MALSILCATFLRLAPVALQPAEIIAETPDRPWFKSVRLEHHSGHRLAVATNGHILAVEYLGATDEADAGFSVPLDSGLLNHCIAAARIGGSISVTGPLIKTTLGFSMFAMNDQRDFDWRKRVPETLTKKATTGAVFDLEHIARLIRSAPTGYVVTERFFDTEKPTIFRDPGDEKWFGMSLMKTAVDPATKPRWIE